MILKNIVRKISEIFMYGSEFAESSQAKRKVKLSNIVSFIVLFTNTSYIPVLHSLNLSHIQHVLVAGSFIYICVPILNRFGFTVFSRICLLSNMVVILLYYSYVLGKHSGVYVMFIAFSSLPFVFFEFKNRVEVIFSASAGLICFIVFEYFDRTRTAQGLLQGKEAEYLAYSIFFSTYLVIFAVVLSLEFTNTRAENELILLKESQDGDYFLTTQIISPLFKNLNSSDYIQTDFLMKQKKSFVFKGRKRELGGDICITGNLNFRGTEYTMFINADAMGKSMQGAGGAIVMGTVINSILSRNAGRTINVQPKQWLTSTYNELQNVFIEFDGSMMISCFLGLISTRSGKMLYLNSEHPSSVILRDEKAFFLEDSPIRKIGFPDSEENIHISEYQLYPGDIIISGSDGRDDINLTPLEKTRKINEDEKLFLSIVEKSKGDLQIIYKELNAAGELIDDLSLMKITYRGNPEERTAQELDMDRIRKLISQSRFHSALQELESLEEESSDKSYIYYHALCLERLGMGTGALDILNKNHSVIKDYIPAQSLKSFIFYRSGEYFKSLAVLEECLKMNPDDPKTLKLTRKIKEKIEQRRLQEQQV